MLIVSEEKEGPGDSDGEDEGSMNLLEGVELSINSVVGLTKP